MIKLKKKTKFYLTYCFHQCCPKIKLKFFWGLISHGCKYSNTCTFRHAIWFLNKFNVNFLLNVNFAYFVYLRHSGSTESEVCIGLQISCFFKDIIRISNCCYAFMIIPAMIQTSGWYLIASVDITN